eukprot:CAMPEP_0115307270 /NCGR_PEP_ID=MMETSP0270-20121206/73043_1 /TAXON_ID=71861 /ORGANISM="Scrippsiella trochoidea, Strain CCMP3099" /LENGTH=66 /DNA_ID=CAMNT_0002725685 /DNA_START=1 /DNA_END=201 /DNA_ORIENTATION=+
MCCLLGKAPVTDSLHCCAQTRTLEGGAPSRHSAAGGPCHALSARRVATLAACGSAKKARGQRASQP